MSDIVTTQSHMILALATIPHFFSIWCPLKFEFFAVIVVTAPIDLEANMSILWSRDIRDIRPVNSRAMLEANQIGINVNALDPQKFIQGFLGIIFHFYIFEEKILRLHFQKDSQILIKQFRFIPFQSFAIPIHPLHWGEILAWASPNYHIDIDFPLPKLGV